VVNVASSRRGLNLGGLVVVLLLLGLWWWTQGDDAADPARTAPEETPALTQGIGPADSTDSTDEIPETDPVSGLGVVTLDELPEEAEETVELIEDGGPFPYERDGVTFGNYEGVLPDNSRGFYREYTVETPGLSHRGARRIVVGGGKYFYWTEDHYESFERIWL
jgi:ribonuclease T1